MGDGFQFFDIILFALIAAFLVLRLRNVLGRRNGHEGGYRDPFKEKPDEQTPVTPESEQENVIPLPARAAPEADGGFFDQTQQDDDALSGVAVGLTQIKNADSSFNIDDFLGGAQAAFEMIVDGFTKGDAGTLKPLLSAEVHGNFVRAIREREQAGETCSDALISIKKAELVEAYLEDRVAHVTIKFVSEQVKATLDENNDVVDGDPNVILQVTDFWTFARDTHSRDPNWALVATRSLD